METCRSQAVNSLDELCVAIASHERRAAEIGVAAAALAASGDWGLDGSVSMAAWMRHHLKMSHTDASRWLCDGRFLANFEPVAEAAVSGLLSASQVDVLRRTVTKPTAELFAEDAEVVVNAIAPLSVEHSVVACNEWRAAAEAVVAMPEPAVPDRSFQTSSLDDGTMLGSFVLDPNGAALLTQALGSAKQFSSGDERTGAQRDADAFVDIISFFLANQKWNGTPRHRPHVELHIGEEIDPTSQVGLHGFNLNGVNLYLKPHAFTSRGKRLLESVADQHLCDCVIHRVIKRGSAVLDFGRSTRTVPHNLFRATACRDGGCRFPGCDRPVAWTQAHHVWHWRRGGPTKLSNLILLCTKHHGIVHSGQWAIQIEPNGNATFTKPDGLVRTSQPRGQPHARAA